jgi:micrococcal nuclease
MAPTRSSRCAAAAGSARARSSSGSDVAHRQPPRGSIRVAWLFGALALLLGAAAAGRAVGSGDSTEAVEANATVVRVVDGDTLVADVDGGEEERVRLIGVNTPESVDPRRPVECFGQEASAHAKALLPEGTRIRIERDAEARDRYGRLLGYVHRAHDGLFVNLAMVADGYAQVMTIPPNVTHADAFAAAQAEARATGRGLWSRCPSGGG